MHTGCRGRWCTTAVSVNSLLLIHFLLLLFVLLVLVLVVVVEALAAKGCATDGIFSRRLFDYEYQRLPSSQDVV